MQIVVVAGEASGDILAAGLIRELSKRIPSAKFEGIAGPLMTAQGCRCIYPMERLSVMGLVEVLGRYCEVLPMRWRLARHYQQQPPALFIGVDAPDFNLHLESKLRAAGIKTVHYVSPSLWAWRRYRINTVRKAVDRMLVLFPFEKEFYTAHGVDAVFVGHPAADRLQPENFAEARNRLCIPISSTVITLLPGSRLNEVNYLAENMVRTAGWLSGRIRNPCFVVPLFNGAIRERFEQALRYSSCGDLFCLLDGDAHTAMSAADVVLSASGTATLECLLLNRPMVITYAGHPVTWEIVSRMLHVEDVGLANLLSGRRVAPELLQQQATPEALGAEVLRILNSLEAQQRQTDAYQSVARSLRGHADENAAQAVIELLEKSE